MTYFIKQFNIILSHVICDDIKYDLHLRRGLHVSCDRKVNTEGLAGASLPLPRTTDLNWAQPRPCSAPALRGILTIIITIITSIILIILTNIIIIIL